MADYKVMQANRAARLKILAIIEEEGPLTATEITNLMGCQVYSNLKILIDEDSLEKDGTIYRLPIAFEDDALDRWFTNWQRPRRRHIPGTRLCNAMTNGIGGWWMRQ